MRRADRPYGVDVRWTEYDNEEENTAWLVFIWDNYEVYDLEIGV